ncbi:hypothetical protein BD626DRAFT_413186 [Schizophyllum amplum]|uniref:BTB domain-containing protein n=1 Tax=Schizophyllum amplum TaxID=97359 RepID=A0A550BW11_9AGAR|nr:hypothetical protein BD626DRAFT_413186 [Auriculariopsis ampla]
MYLLVRFAESDPDVVVFRSADGALFNIHRQNLKSTSDGPFAEGFEAVSGEIVQLTESEETLDVLFTFVYPGVHPILSDLAFDELALLAEAAEKYQVAPAVSVCRMRMIMIHKEHPLGVLRYADKHGYADLMDLAAPYTLASSVRQMRRMLSLPTQAAWADFKETWATTGWPMTADIIADVHSPRYCSIQPIVEQIVETRIKRCVTSGFLDVDRIFEGLADMSTQCEGRRAGCASRLDAWKRALKEKVAAIPPLSGFMSVADA